ncbi:MAG: ATP-binding cassette domain-containing protein [Phycicoccus sp.]
MTILEVDELRVDFSGFTLGPVDLSIDEGIVAVLGPNGSGKTTLLRAMNGLIPRAHGQVRVGNHDLMGRSPTALKGCAFVPDGDQMLFPEFSLDEFWSFYSDVRSASFGEDRYDLLSRAYDLAERLSLAPGRVRMGDFSLGMRRKAQLITGLMTEPDVILVDEPQNGLDFVSSHEVRLILGEARDRGAVILMSNHDLDSVARVADSIVILREGAVVDRSEARFASGDECEAFVAGYFT